MKPSPFILFLIISLLLIQCKKEEEHELSTTICDSGVLDQKGSFRGSIDKTARSTSSQEIYRWTEYYCGSDLTIHKSAVDLGDFPDADSSRIRTYYTIVFGPYTSEEDYTYSRIRPYDSIRFPASPHAQHMADSLLTNSSRRIGQDQRRWVIPRDGYTEIIIETEDITSDGEEDMHTLTIHSNYPFL